ncbi:uncharacterized protein LOC115242863 [Formica exsecta]|uniref:uncharacterized protein LOC115242863 n=1 Tax=Formica exsecta TaxID=72781 RepID=UPI0011427C14|nr:uncharacterized protein LOC115242863 [Formica exsecta]
MRLMIAYSSQLTNRMMYKWKSNIVYDIMCYLNYENSINFERQNIDIEAQYRSITETIEIAVEKPDNTRNKNIKFSIGEIVKHLSQPNFAPPKESIYHEGVIIGWHSKCDPNFQAKMKKTRMFPYLCHHYQNHLICTCASCICFNSKCVSDEQPHYIILTENDKICYVREGMSINSILINHICFMISYHFCNVKFIFFILDHIEICSPKRINNIEIGRFFSRFHGFYYEPNKSLANRY